MPGVRAQLANGTTVLLNHRGYVGMAALYGRLLLRVPGMTEELHSVELPHDMGMNDLQRKLLPTSPPSLPLSQ